MQYVVSKAVGGVDMKRVREREKSTALWARPGSGQHHFLPFSNLAGNGLCILCWDTKGNKFDSLQWKLKEQFKQYTSVELLSEKKKPQYNFKKSWTQKNLI